MELPLDETWTIDGDRFADSFNPRIAIRSSLGRLGYLKALPDGHAPNPWMEQWANEQIVAELCDVLEIPCTQTVAGEVDGEVGAISVFIAGSKVSALHLLGFKPEPVIEAAANSEQLALMVALDVLILNTDRSANNVYITFEEGRPIVRLIDHGHTLLLPREQKMGEASPDDWDTHVASGWFERPELTKQLLECNYLRQYVVMESVRSAARVVSNSLLDEAIEEIIDGVPEEYFFGTRSAVIKLLKNRRDRLADCLEEAA